MVVFGIAPELNSYTTERTRQLFERMEDELAAIPGVTSVVAAIVPVLAGDNWGNSLVGRGIRSGPRHQHQRVVQRRRSRLFQDDGHSADGGPRVHARGCVRRAEGGDRQPGVREEVQPRRQPDRQALRPRRRTDAKLDIEIVGLAQDAKYSDVKDAPPPQYFLPYRQEERLGYGYFYVRTATPPEQMLATIPAVMRKLDASLPLERPQDDGDADPRERVAGSHHQHAVAGVRAAGDGAGGDRPLRRARLHRGAAHARVRTAHGARRRRRRGARHGDEAGGADGDRRRRDRHGDRDRRRPPRQVAAVRNGRLRSAGADGRDVRAGAGRARRRIHSRAARVEDRSDDRAAI